MTNTAEKPVAIVTGAAGGIGLETVRCLQRDGWRICATSLTVSDALSAAMTDKDYVLEADMTSENDIEEIVHQAVDHCGRLDGLVNCAGASAVLKFHEQSNEDWSKFLDVNLSSAFKISRAFLAQCSRLPVSPRSIVLISSLSALTGGANPAYGASKAGVCALVYNMAQTYGETGLRANAVLPGIIDTQMVHNAFPGEKYEKLKAAAAARTPVGRLGRAEDVAELCAFLMSDRASFITGQAVNITGGFELVPPIGKI